MSRPWCRFEGLCVNCHASRYRGEGETCLLCGSTSGDRKTPGKICFQPCKTCLILAEADRNREEPEDHD